MSEISMGNDVKKTCLINYDTHKLHRDSLEEFIDQLPSAADFKIHDWLKTLGTRQLRRIEKDAIKYCDCDAYPAMQQKEAYNLIEVALMAYVAENCSEVDTEEDIDFLDILLVGLAVAACVERLKRAGWVILTSRLGILLQGSRPYRVTQKGLDEGFWSHDPITLWVLGVDLAIH